jgi:hypothetical protein
MCYMYNTWLPKGIDLNIQSVQLLKNDIFTITPTKSAFVLESFSLIENSQKIGKQDYYTPPSTYGCCCNRS